MSKSLFRFILRTAVVVSCASFAVLAEAPKAQKAHSPADTTETKTFSETFIVESRHRVHAKFYQVDTVKLNQMFQLGETDYVAEVVDFIPHLSISMEGKPLKMSDTLHNPAALVRVYQDGKQVQESWAFYFIEAPHFRRDNMLGFKLVDFNVGSKYASPPLQK